MGINELKFYIILVDASKFKRLSCSFIVLIFCPLDLYLLYFYFLLYNIFSYLLCLTSQIKFLHLRAQLRKFMKKGLKMLLYQHFLESMVIYFS